ncbi:hypothetical protein OG395_39180 [Streptomyces sp. NBC_01320]|nr:hypothetical protein OG395_39180 [Streptomyces sp. NBC_01320]
MLTRSGLLDQAQSWVATGENQPVSGARIAPVPPDVDAARHRRVPMTAVSHGQSTSFVCRPAPLG